MALGTLPKSKLSASHGHHFFLNGQRSLWGLFIRGGENAPLLKKSLSKVTHQWTVESRLPNHGG